MFDRGDGRFVSVQLHLSQRKPHKENLRKLHFHDHPKLIHLHLNQTRTCQDQVHEVLNLLLFFLSIRGFKVGNQCKSLYPRIH